MNNIEQKYKDGLPAFKKLFDMNSKDLKAKLSKICGSQIQEHMFDDLAIVKKVIENDEPREIEVWAYDCLSISPFGINFKPEHGNSKTIIEFNQFFTI